MTGTPQSRTETPLDAALAQLRLDGAIFFRSEFSESWGYVSPTAPEIAGMLRPGTARMIIFHNVAEGRCWFALNDRPTGGLRRRGGVQPGLQAEPRELAGRLAGRSQLGGGP